MSARTSSIVYDEVHGIRLMRPKNRNPAATASGRDLQGSPHGRA